MSYFNMVESKTFKETTAELERVETAVLDAENISDSIFRMEYTWDFLKLGEDRDLIAWALSHSESRIRAWHYERGDVDR